LFRESEQALAVVEQNFTRVRQGPVPGRSVDEPFTGGVLEPPNRLTHGRLGAVQLPGGSRETSLARHRHKHPQVFERHGFGSVPERNSGSSGGGRSISFLTSNLSIIILTFGAPGR